MGTEKGSILSCCRGDARKPDGLIKRNSKSDKPLEKCVTDMTEVKCLDGRLCVSAVFDCFDSAVPGLAMDTDMKAALCEKTPDNTYQSYPGIRGCILHSGRGTQYTSGPCRKAASKYGIIQSMNRAGDRCHDNARCISPAIGITGESALPMECCHLWLRDINNIKTSKKTEPITMSIYLTGYRLCVWLFDIQCYSPSFIIQVVHV